MRAKKGWSTRSIRQFLSTGCRWYAHSEVVSGVWNSIRPEVASRFHEAQEAIGEAGFRDRRSLTEKIRYARSRMIGMMLSALTHQQRVLRRGPRGGYSYWLIPRARVARMLNCRLVELRLDDVTVDPEVQPRTSEEIDPRIPEKYAAVLAGGGELPPVMVFQDGDGVNWLADGHYRLQAHRIAGRTTIPACVCDGGKRDAMLYACQANEGHGADRGEGSRRHVVERLLSDPEWSAKGKEWVAKACGVEVAFVLTCRERTRAAAKATKREDGPERRGERTDLADSAKLSQSARAQQQGVSRDTQKKLDALARTAPDLFAKVQAGELKCNAACIQVGIAKPPSPLKELRKWWKKATEVEREQFLAEIGSRNN